MLGNALFGFAKIVVHTIPTSDNQGGNIDWLKAIFVAYLEVQTQFIQVEYHEMMMLDNIFE